MEPIWTAGLMTGTVLDGNIDVALLRTDGETVAEFGPYRLVPYERSVRDLLEQALAEARAWNFEGPEPAVFAEAEQALTRAQAEAVRQVANEAGPGLQNLSLVGFHGQSVLHRAPDGTREGHTRQLGDGALMAEMLDTPVAYDFRSADVAAGGQGAPLSPIYHAALLKDLPDPEGSAVLNLGGVANVSYLDPEGNLMAFDTGPANAPINDFIKARGRGEMDRDGALARAGSVDEARLAQALDHPFLSRPYPKSLDRFDFGTELGEGLSDEDGAATLTAFTAAAVGRALDLLPTRPRRLIVCGGGRHNPALMEMIATRAQVRADPAESVGWRGDAVEAECFAFLAARVERGLPISFPLTTGAPRPLAGGRIARP